MTLTSEQLSVVNLVSGRHLVLAPPGSGKTEMLSQRIVRALGSGVDPTKMLCATFTNRAAFGMRDRVAGAAGPDCERHYFKINFRATPLLLEILMRFSLDALRSEWEFLPAPSDVTRANGEVSLSPSGSPKAILEKLRHLLGEAPRKPPFVEVLGFLRPNLRIGVMDCSRAARKLARTVEIVNRLKNGIIYVATRKHAQTVYEELQRAAIRAGRISSDLVGGAVTRQGDFSFAVQRRDAQLAG